MASALHQILPALPSEAAPAVAWIAAAGAAFGVALWLLGSRFSRQLVALVAVTVGAALGLQAPRWFGLSIGAWSSAVVGALVLGVVGFLFHKTFVRFGLGLLLAAWGVLATWLLYAADAKWNLPSRGDSQGLLDYAVKFWDSIPPDLRLRAPIAAGIGLVLAAAVSFLLPRLTIALFYSLIGFAMIVTFGSLAISQLRPGLLDLVPQDHSALLIITVGAVAFGTLFQWWFGPRASRSAPAQPKKQEDNAPGVKKGDG